jgi:hypothetical protein
MDVEKIHRVAMKTEKRPYLLEGLITLNHNCQQIQLSRVHLWSSHAGCATMVIYSISLNMQAIHVV